MRSDPIPIWKECPFVRLLLPLIIGIIVQWYIHLPVIPGCLVIIFSLTGITLFPYTAMVKQFRKYWIHGVLLNLILFFAGALLTHLKDERHYPNWINNVYREGSVVFATIEEPLSEKTRSYKTVASIKQIRTGDSIIAVKGRCIIYFQKNDSLLLKVDYGTRIIFFKSLQPVKNSNNPGSFDYERYCYFQGIYHQIYLKSNEFVILKKKDIRWLKKFLYDARMYLVGILRKYIPGNKESGLAEALLIGYKDDLDKNLIQSYSNTGVVHIIAISGLHLGLIYWLLARLLNGLLKRQKLQLFKPVIVISALWLFSLLAGGTPSVLRSAVMFTCLVAGESLARRTSIFNTLAASAFLLLCFHPFWLWDVGFQLSYAALLSIIIFMKPIYNWLFLKNRLLDAAWKLIAVTLAAQFLTVPISLCHFHQFPNFFVITNLIAVPLSSIILIGGLLLCAVSFNPIIAKAIGWTIQQLIRLMNSIIKYIDTLPYGVWNDLHISFVQAIFLYITIIAFGYWLLHNSKFSLLIALTGLLVLVTIRTNSLFIASTQKKLIVYNVPNYQAIDFIAGRHYVFVGDSILSSNVGMENFHLKSSRIMNRLNEENSVPALDRKHPFYLFNDKRILVIDRPFLYKKSSGKIAVDIIIVSRNPKLQVGQVLEIFDCKQIVFDASNTGWKIMNWKSDCERLRLDCYSVVDNGAFVMTLN